MRNSGPIAAIAAVVAMYVALVAANLDSLSSRGSPSASSGGALVPRAYRDSPLPETIDLAGEVVAHGGAATGTVRIRVGETSSQQVTTIAPQFLVTVHGVRASDMVTLEIGGSGFKYTSLLGTYGKLVRQAGADRVLTLAESDALHVSPLSTALQFFVQRAVGGTPATDGRIENAMRSVSGDDLVWASSVLANLATGAVALPAGYANGYALLQNREAYRAFLSEHPELIYEAGAALAAIPAGTFSVEDTTRTTALLDPIANLDAPLLAPQAQVIERDGTGYLVHASDGRRDSRFSGSLESTGALTLTPVGQIYSETFSGGSCPSTGHFFFLRTQLVGETHRMLRRGDRTSLRLVMATYEQSAPTCPDIPVTEFTAPHIWAAVDLAQAEPVMNGRRFLGVRALPYFCIPSAAPSQLAVCEYALHRFDGNGNGAVLELGAKVDAVMSPTLPDAQSPFTWHVTSPSVLTLDSAIASTRYWLQDGGNGLVAGLIYVGAATIEGADVSLAGYAPMLNGNVPAGYASLSPIGTWQQSVFEQYIEPYAYDDGSAASIVRTTRSANGTAVRATHVPHYPEFDFEQESLWALSNGRLYDTRVRGNNGRTYRECSLAFAAGATKCVPSTVRYFRPMVRSGNVLYGIEETYTNLSDFDPPFVPSRTTRSAYQALQP